MIYRNQLLEYAIKLILIEGAIMQDTTAYLPHIRLDFNIKHPSIEECYVDGYLCATNEMQELENPFKEGSLEARNWSDGWWAGFYGDEPLFDFTTVAAEETAFIKSKADNDAAFSSPKMNLYLLRFLEISGALAVSALVGYQLIEMVA